MLKVLSSSRACHQQGYFHLPEMRNQKKSGRKSGLVLDRIRNQHGKLHQNVQYLLITLIASIQYMPHAYNVLLPSESLGETVGRVNWCDVLMRMSWSKGLVSWNIMSTTIWCMQSA